MDYLFFGALAVALGLTVSSCPPIALREGGAPPSAPTTFQLDLRNASLPTGVAFRRSSAHPIMLRTSASGAVMVSGATADLKETVGSFTYRQTFPTYTNLLADPDDFTLSHGDPLGWKVIALTLTAGAAAGPHGIAGKATKLTDANAGTLGQLQYQHNVGATPSSNQASIWIRDDTVDAPSVSPTGRASPIADYSTGNVTIPNGAGWKRVSVFLYQATFGGANLYLQLVGLAAGGQGSVFVSRAQILWALRPDLPGAFADVPLVEGTAGNADMSIDGPTAAEALNAGVLQIEHAMLTEPVTTYGGTEGAPYWLWSLDTPNGDCGVKWFAQGMRAVVNDNGDHSSGSLGDLPIDSIVHTRYRVSGTGVRLQLAINGCVDMDVATATVHALATPTAGAIGSRLGADGFAPIKHLWLMRTTASLDDAEGVLEGDSLWSLYGSLPPVCRQVYTQAQVMAGRSVRSLAAPGWTYGDYTGQDNYQGSLIEQWMASALRGNPSVRYVVVAATRNELYFEIGGNPITGPQYAALLEDHIADINAEHPGVPVIVLPIPPTGASLDAAQKIALDYVNAAIVGTANALAGDDLVRGALWTDLADNAIGDSTSNLHASVDSGDGVHVNQAGHDIMAAELITLLDAHGLREAP